MLTGSEMQFFAIIPRISGYFYIFFNENNEVSKKKIAMRNGIDPVPLNVVDYNSTTTPNG